MEICVCAGHRRCSCENAILSVIIRSSRSKRPLRLEHSVEVLATKGRGTGAVGVEECVVAGDRGRLELIGPHGRVPRIEGEAGVTVHPGERLAEEALDLVVRAGVVSTRVVLARELGKSGGDAREGREVRLSSRLERGEVVRVDVEVGHVPLFIGISYPQSEGKLKNSVPGRKGQKTGTAGAKQGQWPWRARRACSLGSGAGRGTGSRGWHPQRGTCSTASQHRVCGNIMSASIP